MNRMIARALRRLLLSGVFLLPGHVHAHGTHIWFVSPKENSAVKGKVTFEIEAPHAKSRYIHLVVTRPGEEKPKVKGLVNLEDKKYKATIDVTDWEKGEYEARVILLGAIHQHPVRTRFVVGEAPLDPAAKSNSEAPCHTHGCHRPAPEPPSPPGDVNAPNGPKGNQ